MPEDVLERVQWWDAGVGHPGRSGVAQAVPGEVGQAEPRDDAVPVGGVADGRGGEVAALRANEELVFGFLALREAFQDGAERFEDRHLAVFAALGRLVTRPPLPGNTCRRITTKFLPKSTSPTCNPDTSEDRAASSAASIRSRCRTGASCRTLWRAG